MEPRAFARSSGGNSRRRSAVPPSKDVASVAIACAPFRGFGGTFEVIAGSRGGTNAPSDLLMRDGQQHQRSSVAVDLDTLYNTYVRDVYARRRRAVRICVLRGAWLLLFKIY